MNLAFLIDFAVVCGIGAIASTWFCFLGLVSVALGVTEGSKVDNNRRHALDSDFLLLTILLGIGFVIAGCCFTGMSDHLAPSSIRVLAGIASGLVGFIVALNYSKFLNKFYFQRAQECVASDAISDALEDFDEVIRSSRQWKSQSLYLQAACFCRLGQFERAERNLEKLGLAQTSLVDAIKELAGAYPALSETERNAALKPRYVANLDPLNAVADPNSNESSSKQTSSVTTGNAKSERQISFEYNSLRSAKPRTNYRESGRFSTSRLFFWSLLGSSVCIVLGIIYSLCITLSPSVKLNFALVFLAGSAVGLVTYCISRLGHVRNRLINYGIAVSLTLVTLYSSWATSFLYNLNCSVNGEGFEGVAWVAPTPSVLTQWAQWLFVNGSWSLSESGEPVTGYYLLSAWIAETILFLTCAIGVTYDRTRNAIYCESCRCWMKFESDRVKLPTKASDTAMHDIKNGDLKAIMKMSIDREQRSHLTMRLCLCPNCDENRCLEISEHYPKIVNGDVVNVETRIAGPLPISGDEEKELRALAYSLMELNEELASARYKGYESTLTESSRPCV